jgi:hypothetical protein
MFALSAAAMRGAIDEAYLGWVGRRAAALLRSGDVAAFNRERAWMHDKLDEARRLVDNNLLG